MTYIECVDLDKNNTFDSMSFTDHIIQTFSTKY